MIVDSTLEREVIEAAVAQRLARLAYEEWLSHHACLTRAERDEQGRRWQPIAETMDRLRAAVDDLLEYRREHDGNA